jgi:hypothetical protein
VARAKRTDRAEARRRYRALVAEGLVEEPEEPRGPAPASARAAAATPPPTQGRIGIVEAFRRSTGPADIRGDVAALPWLARHTKAIWLPALVVAVSTILLAMPGGLSNPWIVLAGQALVYPPPMATSFLAGILAPRASWLAGGIAGIFAAIGFSVLVLTAAPLTVDAQAPSRESLIGYGLVSSPLFGVAIGAFAGFYRRFLALSNPNRGRRPQGRQTRVRPAARRR